MQLHSLVGLAFLALLSCVTLIGADQADPSLILSQGFVRNGDPEVCVSYTHLSWSLTALQHHLMMYILMKHAILHSIPEVNIACDFSSSTLRMFIYPHGCAWQNDFLIPVDDDFYDFQRNFKESRLVFDHDKGADHFFLFSSECVLCLWQALKKRLTLAFVLLSKQCESLSRSRYSSAPMAFS